MAKALQQALTQENIMMHNSPRISIVTPSLNHGAYIEDAILSVLAQSYANFEHIVIDGGSQDNTLAILRRYPHLRWVSEPDQGQSDALNKGFQMASGDLVGWLNSDEYYLPGALHAIAQYAVMNPDAEILYGNCISVNEDGFLQRSRLMHDFDFNILLYYGTIIPTAASFFKRSLFQQGFLLDLGYRVTMDYEYFVRLATCGKVFKYTDRFLAAFRWHGSNMSLQHKKRRDERLRVQRTFSTFKLSNAGYDTLAEIFRAKRVTVKILNGSYWRELRVLRHTGGQTRWFCNEEGRKTCTNLLP